MSVSSESQPSPQSAKPPSSDPGSPPSSAQSGARRWRLWGILGASGVALVAFGLMMFSEGEVTATVSADVPRVEDRRIVFSEAFAERIQLKDAAARVAPLTPVVSAVGMVTFDPKYVARVGTRLRGLVREVAHYEGDRVKAGDLLAEIDSPELGDAQAQVTMLSAQAKTATRAAEREQALADQNLTTAREAEEAATQQSSYESMLRAARQKVHALAGGVPPSALGVHKLMSPLDGTVVERKVTKGELVEGDHVAFLVADLAHLWVELDVFERNLAGIAVGDEVEVRALSGSTPEIKGRVAQVGAVIDPATRSATVRIEVDNREGHLRPGQAVDAKIRASHATQGTALLVPSDAVTFVDGEPTVFVMTAPLTVQPTVVELGDSNGVEKQVLKGIKPGDRVVVQGVFELKSELFR